MGDRREAAWNQPFYYTFLNGEAVLTLKQDCSPKHRKGEPNTPLFYARTRKPMSQTTVRNKMKRCIRESRRLLRETRMERLEKELESTMKLLKESLEERKSEQKG